jgi:hypothetical protein
MRVSGGQSGIPVAMSCLACSTSPAVAYVDMMGRKMKKNKVAAPVSLGGDRGGGLSKCIIFFLKRR